MNEEATSKKGTQEEKATTQKTTHNTPRKSGKGGLIAAGGCCGCFGLLIIWLLGMLFLFGPTLFGPKVENGIDEADYDFNDTLNYNLNSKDYSSNTNYNEAEDPSLDDSSSTSTESVIPAEDMSFGVLENGKFFRPISLNSKESYTFAARFNKGDLEPGKTIQFSAYNDGDRQDYTAVGFSTITEDTEQEVTLDVEAGTAEYYIELFLYVDDTFIGSQIISMLQE